MKRIFVVFLMWIIMEAFALPCYAAGTSSNNEREDVVSADVSGRFSSDIQWKEVPVNDGSAVVTTDDGYTVTVTGIPAEAVIIKVFSILSSETFARDWMDECISEEYDIQSAFDIYFEDASENRINADGVQIIIEECDNDCITFSISITNQVEKLDNINENGAVRFTANGSNYYVLAKKVSVEKPVDSDEGTVSENSASPELPRSPATDDNNPVMFWHILSIVSGITLTVMFLWWKICLKDRR